MATYFEVLQNTSDEELIKMHDGYAGSQTEGYVQIREELARRGAAKQGDRIEAMTMAMTDMTRTIKRLTWFIAACTVVGTIAAVVAAIAVFVHL